MIKAFVFLWLATLSMTFAQSSSQPTVWNLARMMTEKNLPIELWGEPRVARVAGHDAVSFDGVDDGLLVETNPLTGLSTFTLEALIFPASDGPAEQRFFHAADNEDRRALLETRVEKGSWALDTFLKAGNEQCALLDMTKRHPCDEWYWVTLAFDGTQMHAYVNGVHELSGNVAWTPLAAGKTSLGVRQNRVYWFKGAIAEIRVTPDGRGQASNVK